MVSGEPARTVIKRLQQAGFTQSDRKGSHTKWTHRNGAQVTVPTGHRTISPGVVRQVNKAVQQSQGK